MKKSTVIILWGVITAVLTMAFNHLMNTSDNLNSSLKWIGYIIFFAGLMVGTLQYRKANGGYLTFGEGYKAGIMLSLIIIVLSTIHLAVFLQMHPEFPQRLMDQAKAKWVNQGLSADQIDKATQFSKVLFSNKVLVIMAFVGGAIGGAILSLLSAAIAGKRKPLLEEDNTPLQ